ncbi:MAG: Crp/Fnr family transcriptional regulator [Bacteroidota bacterium]
MNRMIAEYLKSFQLLTGDEIQSTEDLLKYKRLKKGDFFIKEGKISQEVAFISSGILRSYYYSSKGEEVTYCFTFANSFVSAYSSFLTQEKTAENIQALTDIEMYAITREEVLTLEQSSTNWLSLFKLIAEQEYVKMEKRIFLLQTENAEKRYEDLRVNHPEYLREIPLSYLSSYLGITPRHLSRIRASFAN